MTSDSILSVSPLGFPWETSDPFLFCAHHDDAYPAGNEHMGPVGSLAGRQIGQDFVIKDGWRMYHGDVVPGFPRHPHRGFETVTLARQGCIDHSDSLGATARFGHGDAQWMTAGRGIVHAEMFPLIHRDKPNPAELFQIWLNLPSADKLVDPHFAMLWGQSIPRHEFLDDAGRRTEVVTVAGALADKPPPAPPPSSWAARPGTDVAIWTLKLAPHARWTLPAAAPGSSRSLYLFRGGAIDIDGMRLSPSVRVQVRPDAAIALANGDRETELLLLQGKPIGEPVAQHGPFVMNTRAELQQAFVDYQRTEFGGWPWPADDPVHPRDKGRFAIHADGQIDEVADA